MVPSCPGGPIPPPVSCPLFSSNWQLNSGGSEGPAALCPLHQADLWRGPAQVAGVALLPLPRWGLQGVSAASACYLSTFSFLYLFSPSCSPRLHRAQGSGGGGAPDSCSGCGGVLVGKEPDSDLRQGSQQLPHPGEGHGEGTLLGHCPERHLVLPAARACGGWALRTVAERLLFCGLVSDTGTGEMAGAAAALGDRGKLHSERGRAPQSLGKGHSSLPSPPSILTLLLTMAEWEEGGPRG